MAVRGLTCLFSSPFSFHLPKCFLLVQLTLTIIIWKSFRLVAYSRELCPQKLITASLRLGTTVCYEVLPVLRIFRTCTLFKEKPFDYFKDLHKLKLLTNSDVNLTSSPGGRVDSKLNVVHCVFSTPLVLVKSD